MFCTDAIISYLCDCEELIFDKGFIYVFSLVKLKISLLWENTLKNQN